MSLARRRHPANRFCRQPRKLRRWPNKHLEFCRIFSISQLAPEVFWCVLPPGEWSVNVALLGPRDSQTHPSYVIWVCHSVGSRKLLVESNGHAADLVTIQPCWVAEPHGMIHQLANLTPLGKMDSPNFPRPICRGVANGFKFKHIFKVCMNNLNVAVIIIRLIRLIIPI